MTERRGGMLSPAALNSTTVNCEETNDGNLNEYDHKQRAIAQGRSHSKFTYGLICTTA